MITPTQYLQDALGIPFKGGAKSERPSYGMAGEPPSASYHAIETKRVPGGSKSVVGIDSVDVADKGVSSIILLFEHHYGSLFNHRG